MPACIDIVGVRSTIYIYYCRIFLLRVEVHRFYKTIIKVCNSVGPLDGASAELGLVVALPWVCGSEILGALAILGIDNGNLAWNGRLREVVEDVSSACADRAVVPALA